MKVNCYEEDLATCDDVFNHYILSDQFYGFITIGILAKYAKEQKLYPRDFKLLVRERGYDLKSKCDGMGVYFSRSCSKALEKKHPVKLLRCADIQDAINQGGIKAALSQLKLKRSTIDQLLYEMLGSVSYRAKFLELGWNILDLPYLTTPLYKIMVKYIVDNRLMNKSEIHNSIIQDINENKKWWLKEYASDDFKPGFIYVAMLDGDEFVCRVKIGQTEREIKKRHNEHLRSKKINSDTTFLCKYVSSPSDEEASILSYLKQNGQLVNGREEFIINKRHAMILKEYLVSDISFCEFITQLSSD